LLQKGGQTMKRSDFLKQVAEYAKADYQRSKVLPSLTISQAILESGWGNSGLAKKSNNLFGIKAGKSWKGAKRSYPTKEFVGGKWITIDAFFREYPTFEGSVKDHNSLLQNKRYAKVLTAKDYKEACHEVWKAGYATDPNYPALLIRIIEKLKLYVYDEEVLYMLKADDANRLIRLVQAEYAKATTDQQRKEWHRLAEELRRVSGQKK
jgi:flagellum-specific peptidoglycan hydrolase FlgJ